MVINVNREPFIYIPDTCRPGEYKMIKNPDWDGELPDIISFTEFLKWNYTLDYGRYIRESHEYGILPLPYGIPRNAKIKTVIITEGYYDRIDQFSFDMRVICDIVFKKDDCRQCQKYIVNGYYCSYGGSNFLCSVEMYNGEYIRLNHPLDEFLVPILSKKDFEDIAQEILDGFYPYKSNYPCRINTAAMAEAMGLDIKYARLSKNGKVKSKLILDRRDTTVYNIAGYVEDYDVDYSFPEDHTYTLTLRHVSEIMEISEEFEELVNTGRFIYLDGHVVLNSDKYVERFNGHAMKLTEYARRHMSECCLDFKRDYENPDYEYTFGELHKDDLAPIEKRELSEAELKRVLTVFNEVEDDNMKLCKTPTINAFGQAVQFHIILNTSRHTSSLPYSSIWDSARLLLP